MDSDEKSALISQLPLAVAITTTITTLVLGVLGLKIQGEIAENQRKNSEEQAKIEQTRLNSEYVIKITEMLLSSIKEKNEESQKAIIPIIRTIENKELKEGLARALGTSEDAGVAAQATSIANEVVSSQGLAAEYELQVYYDKTPDNYFKQLKIGSGLSPSTQLITKSIGEGATWDFDIYICEDKWNGGKVNKNIIDFASKLARISDNGTKLSGETVGRVRIRPMPSFTNSKSENGIQNNVIKPLDSSEVSKSMARKIAAISKIPLSIEPRPAKSRYYMGVFFCGKK